IEDFGLINVREERRNLEDEKEELREIILGIKEETRISFILIEFPHNLEMLTFVEWKMKKQCRSVGMTKEKDPIEEETELIPMEEDKVQISHAGEEQLHKPTKEDSDGRDTFDEFEYEDELLEEAEGYYTNARPIKQAAYRSGPKEQEFLKEQVKEMLNRTSEDMIEEMEVFTLCDSSSSSYWPDEVSISDESSEMEWADNKSEDYDLLDNRSQDEDFEDTQ
ncbi:11861_t:CDS:2, partial [Scutellospora calospora]